MATPKGYRKKLNLNNPKIGMERRKEILDEATVNTTNLPKGVMIEDMDSEFIEFANSDMSITIDGQKVPVIFLSLQRWTEFAKSWQTMDEFNNLKLPFITIVRNPDIQQGENQSGYFNIPGRQNWTYLRVPNNKYGKDGSQGIDIYKIPQPVAVDVTYEVRFFSNKMRDLNETHRIIQKLFQSRQHYITPNGHYMPLHLENVSDESEINDINSRRYYVQMFEMKLLGYILDENDFEVSPAITRILLMNEIATKQQPRFRVKTNKLDKTINITIVSKPNSTDEVEFTSQYDSRYDEIQLISNVNDVTMFVNGIQVTSFPIMVKQGDRIRLVIDKNPALTGRFILKGVII
jgi:hypothetical protein